MAFDTTSLSALTQDLMRFKTIQNENEQIFACLEYIKKYFQETSLNIATEKNADVTSIILTKGTKTPTVFLCGHLDVVPADEQQFMPIVDGDRLIGRGALDMKSGVAALMAVMKDVANTPHSVGLMLTTDEEIGGFNGTSALLNLGYSCKAAVLPDGGKAVHRVVRKAKGILQLELNAAGTPSHGSTPWLGSSAISRLTQAIDRVQATFIALQDHPEDHWVATCNIGTIQGGTATNQVAGHASATCDIRHTECESSQDILQRIKNTLPDGVTVTQLLTAPPTYAPENNPFVSAYEEAIAEIGLLPAQGADHGSSDARFFSERNIPVLISQPDGDGHHTDHEWVSINSIRTYARVVRSFLDKVAL